MIMKSNNIIRSSVYVLVLLLILLGSGCSGAVSIEENNSSWTENTLMIDTVMETESYLYDTGNPGTTIAVVGGIHGSETAGFKAAQSLKDNAEDLIQSGRILFIPRANNLATEQALRYPKDMMDLNRAFTGQGDSDLTLALAKEIKEAVVSVSPDLVIDHHESLNNYKNGRLGNTLIVSDYEDNLFEGLTMIDLVNPELKSQASIELPFILESNPPVGSINKTLTQEQGYLVVTIETNRKLELESRIQQQLIIAKTLIDHYSTENTRK